MPAVAPVQTTPVAPPRARVVAPPPDLAGRRPDLRLVATRQAAEEPRPPSPPVPRVGRTLVTARSFREYVGMFGLSRGDLDGARILDVPGGAASFVADARRHGVDAVAVDPAYAAGHDTLARHARAETRRANAFSAAAHERFDWSRFGGVEGHDRERSASLERFVAHRRREPERYVAASLPTLPYEPASHDLVLSSHLLFSYDDRLDLAFHVAAALELLRVARHEVRVYPTVSASTWARSVLVEPLVALVRAAGFRAECRPVAWEHQRGADELLVLSRPGA